jgi:hypothetical protein
MNKKTELSKAKGLSKLIGLCTLFVCLSIITSCKKSESIPIENSISNPILEKLKAAGFDTSEGLTKFQDGYLVEYDIFLTEEAINRLNDSSFVKIPVKLTTSNKKVQSKSPISHYTSDKLVGAHFASQRNIQIYMDTSFGTYLLSALDQAISRYNSLELSVKFTRTTNSSLANITFAPVSSATFLMSSGIPDAAGNPYHQILVNTSYFNPTTNRADATSVLAHEIGHAIGFRHTDYMNRFFSCYKPNDPFNNEGSAPHGANYVPGTPSDPIAGSWMLSCSDGSDRPFTESDIIALKGTYPLRKNIYMKMVWDLVSDESTSDWKNDHQLTTHSVRVEFYQDANKTIPYTTTSSSQLLLNLLVYQGSSTYITRVLAPVGVSSYDLGLFVTDVYYTEGQVTQDYTSGLALTGFPGYYGP